MQFLVVIQNITMQNNVLSGHCFWFDWWTDLGPLITVFGNRGRRDLRIPTDSHACTAALNGEWRLPAARSEEAETLQVVLSTMQPPSDSRGKDGFLWCSRQRSFKHKFSSKTTWNFIREPAPLVSWSKLVWFKHIPRCSFVCWMAMLNRLPTKDRLISWGMTVPPVCSLCSLNPESHDHLFFSCPYSVAVWTHFSGWMFSIPPVSLASVAHITEQAHIVSRSGAQSIIKLLMQVVIYNLWKERNHRIFRHTPSSEAAIISGVDRSMRDRLLSLPPPSQGSLSLLSLYFSIRSSSPPQLCLVVFNCSFVFSFVISCSTTTMYLLFRKW